jgi:hypothetical protein
MLMAGKLTDNIDATKWFTGPLSRLVHDIGTQSSYLNTVSQSLEILSKPNVIQAIKNSGVFSSNANFKLDNLHINAKIEVKEKHQKISRDFVIILYSLVEAGIIDLLKNIFANEPLILDSKILKTIKITGNVLLFSQPNELVEECCKIYLDGLGGTAGYNKFERAFEIIGLKIGVHKKFQRDITELAQVRNAYVHRLGIADNQLLDICGWIK